MVNSGYESWLLTINVGVPFYLIVKAFPSFPFEVPWSDTFFLEQNTGIYGGCCSKWVLLSIIIPYCYYHVYDD